MLGYSKGAFIYRVFRKSTMADVCSRTEHAHVQSDHVTDILSQNTYIMANIRCFLMQHIISDFLFKICIMVDIRYSLKKYMANI